MTPQVYIRNLNNELTKTLKVPNSVDNIFYAGTGLLLLRTEESMALLDIQRKEVLAELVVPPVKYVVWSNDMTCVALISKHCTSGECVRADAAVWSGP